MKNRLSIHHRLLTAASCVLCIFLGMTGWVLDEALNQRLENSLKNELKAHVYALLSAMDENAQGELMMTKAMFDPRFSQLDSGLYAQLVSNQLIWQSDSLLGKTSVYTHIGELGKWRYAKRDDLLLLNLTFAWQQLNGQEKVYTLAVMQTLKNTLLVRAQFQETLLIWLGGLGVVLLMIQGVLLYWGLMPLRHVAKKLTDIETGKAELIEGDYPRELSGLTDNINSLIKHDRARQHRFKRSLGDLAHSLKTPLAVLQSCLDSQDQQTIKKGLIEQLPYMNQLITYQLKKVNSEQVNHIIQAVYVSELTQRLVNSLVKVYADKSVKYELNIQSKVMFSGDQGDWMEMAGNLLDNAFKYCQSSVSIALEQSATQVILTIMDDGKGIDVDQYQNILTRGMRLDEQQNGQGIGLSVVNELVLGYQGSLQLSKGAQGGLKVVLSFDVKAMKI